MSKTKFFTDIEVMFEFTTTLFAAGKNFVTSGDSNGWVVDYE